MSGWVICSHSGRLDGLNPAPADLAQPQRSPVVMQMTLGGIVINAQQGLCAQLLPGMRAQQRMPPQCPDVGGVYQQLEFGFVGHDRNQQESLQSMRRHEQLSAVGQ